MRGNLGHRRSGRALAVLGLCATIGLLLTPFSSSGLGNADAGVKKEFLTFVTVRYAQYEEVGRSGRLTSMARVGAASPLGMFPTSPRTAGGLPLSTVRTSSG